MYYEDLFPVSSIGVVVSVLLHGSVTAQSTTWKPALGEKFICQITESCNCGDYACAGTDTVAFEIIDTESVVDSTHTNVVIARTRAIALHTYKLVWGAGWDSTLIGDTYRDSTLLSFRPDNIVETDLRAGVSPPKSPKWQFRLAFDKDTSVLFEDSMQSALIPTAGFAKPIFLPSVGWFYKIGGSQWDGGVCCPAAGVESWTLTLIAVVRPIRSVSYTHQSNSPTLISSEFITLSASADQISLFDLPGRVVRSWRLNPSGPATVSLSVADVPNGLYFLRTDGPKVDEMLRAVIRH